MARRLIKFRGTNDFARVNGRPRRAQQPHYTWNGHAWVITNTSGDDAIHGPIWRSCNPTPFEQNMSYTRFVTFSTITSPFDTMPVEGALGGSSLLYGLVGSNYATGATATAGVGGSIAAFGGLSVGLIGLYAATLTRQTTHGGAFQNTNAPRFLNFNSNLTPCPQQDPLSFAEPTFEEFQQQYAAQLAGQVPSTDSNTTPTEAQ